MSGWWWWEAQSDNIINNNNNSNFGYHLVPLSHTLLVPYRPKLSCVNAIHHSSFTRGWLALSMGHIYYVARTHHPPPLLPQPRKTLFSVNIFSEVSGPPLFFSCFLFLGLIAVTLLAYRRAYSSTTTARTLRRRDILYTIWCVLGQWIYMNTCWAGEGGGAQAINKTTQSINVSYSVCLGHWIAGIMYWRGRRTRRNAIDGGGFDGSI